MQAIEQLCLKVDEDVPELFFGWRFQKSQVCDFLDNDLIYQHFENLLIVLFVVELSDDLVDETFVLLEGLQWVLVVSRS